MYVGVGEYLHVSTSVFGGQGHTGTGVTGHQVVSTGNTLSMYLGLNEGEWATPKPVSQ